MAPFPFSLFQRYKYRPLSMSHQSQKPVKTHASYSSLGSALTLNDEQNKVPKPYSPIILHFVVAIGSPLFVISMGIGLEIALFFSQKNNGFAVPQQNIFGTLSAQFLTSSIPAMLVLPTSVLLTQLDWYLRLLQPYITMRRRSAKAEETVLLDYIYLGPFLGMARALAYKHRVLFWSSFAACSSYLYQPIAGSILQVRQIPQIGYSNVTSYDTIGANLDILQTLDAFSAASGYVSAAITYGLPDPPFVQGGWTTAEFSFPTNQFLNGTMSVNTTGIQSVPDCANPGEKPIISLIANQNLLSLSSKSVGGCVHSVTFDPSLPGLQSGVEAVPCPDDVASFDVHFQPVMFWFVHRREDDNSLEAKTVFCTPSLTLSNVMAWASLDDGSLISVTELDNISSPNNLTNSAFGEKVLNGVIFSNSSNPFIQARVASVPSIITDAISQAALQLPDGPQSTFDLPNGFLDLTLTSYTRHLALVAKSAYFVRENTTLPSEIIAITPRLVIDPLPAHLLSILFVLSGFTVLCVQIIHRRQRLKIHIASTPGSIASVLSQTAHSGFGDLLMPYDDDATMEKKLEGYRFRLDQTTGAIVADDYRPSSYSATSSRPFSKGGRVETPSSIYTSRTSSTASPAEATFSSSQLAYQAAAGYMR